MTRGIRTNHERKVNLARGWQKLPYPVKPKESKRVRAADIPNDRVVELALGMGLTPNPTTDLIRVIERTFECSGNIAAKVFDRVLDAGLIETKVDNSKLTTYWKWVTPMGVEEE